MSIKRLAKREIARGRAEYPTDEHAAYERPTRREDCLPGGVNGARPCPWVSCRHHLYLDVNGRTRSYKLNLPGLEVWELPESCVLDIADRAGLTIEETGALINLTRERIRQLEMRALRKLRSAVGGIESGDEARVYLPVLRCGESSADFEDGLGNTGVGL